MRKFINLFLAICMALTFASCTDGDIQVPPSLEETNPTQVEEVMPPESSSSPQQTTPAPDAPTPEPFPGKIGIITNSADQSDVDFYGGQNVAVKYGKTNIIHTFWSASLSDKETYMSFLTRLGGAQDIQVIITNPAIEYVSETISELRKNRNDIYYICIDPEDDPADIAQQADIILGFDWVSMGSTSVQQAQKLGAKTFVHYSFPRHMSQILTSYRRELIKQECEKFNIEFVDVTMPDPTDGAGDALQFVSEDVPKLVAKYGKDTAFYITFTNASSLINAVMDAGAIYIQQSEVSLYSALPTTFGIEICVNHGRNLITLIPPDELVSQISSALAEKNMLGRISALPVDPSMMFVEVSAEYAIKRLNGEVQQEGVDVDVLKQLMEDYAGVEVFLTPYTDEETGETYENYLLVRMDYITFE